MTGDSKETRPQMARGARPAEEVAASPDALLGSWETGPEPDLILAAGEVAVTDGQDRERLLGELKTINAAIGDLGVAARAAMDVAVLCPPDELARLVAAARHQYLDVLHQLGGTG